MTTPKFFFIAFASLSLFVSCGRQSQRETEKIALLQAADGRYYKAACLQKATESSLNDCAVNLDTSSTSRGARNAYQYDYTSAYGSPMNYYSSGNGYSSNLYLGSSYNPYSPTSSPYAPNYASLNPYGQNSATSMDLSLYFLLNLSAFQPNQLCSQFGSIWGNNIQGCYQFFGISPEPTTQPYQANYSCSFQSQSSVAASNPFALQQWRAPGNCYFPWQPNVGWVNYDPDFYSPVLVSAQRVTGTQQTEVRVNRLQGNAFSTIEKRTCELNGYCQSQNFYASHQEINTLRGWLRQIRQARRYYQPSPGIQRACSLYQPAFSVRDSQAEILISDCRDTVYKVPGSPTDQLLAWLNAKTGI